MRSRFDRKYATLYLVTRAMTGILPHTSIPSLFSSDTFLGLFVIKCIRLHDVIQNGLDRIISSQIVLKPKHAVRVDCVGAGLLQRIRSNFVGQANAPAFLLEVYDYASVLLRVRYGAMELFAAVTASRAKNFRGGASVVHAHGNRSINTFRVAGRMFLESRRARRI